MRYKSGLALRHEAHLMKAERPKQQLHGEIVSDLLGLDLQPVLPADV